MAKTESYFVALSPGRGSITLPASLRRRHHLDEPGAQVEIIEHVETFGSSDEFLASLDREAQERGLA
jgi:hypothetical protein